jgi:hypothetical protein
MPLRVLFNQDEFRTNRYLHCFTRRDYHTTPIDSSIHALSKQKYLFLQPNHAFLDSNFRHRHSPRRHLNIHNRNSHNPRLIAILLQIALKLFIIITPAQAPTLAFIQLLNAHIIIIARAHTRNMFLGDLLAAAAAGHLVRRGGGLEDVFGGFAVFGRGSADVCGVVDRDVDGDAAVVEVRAHSYDVAVEIGRPGFCREGEGAVLVGWGDFAHAALVYVEPGVG